MNRKGWSSKQSCLGRGRPEVQQETPQGLRPIGSGSPRY